MKLIFLVWGFCLGQVFTAKTDCGQVFTCHKCIDVKECVFIKTSENEFKCAQKNILAELSPIAVYRTLKRCQKIPALDMENKEPTSLKSRSILETASHFPSPTPKTSLPHITTMKPLAKTTAASSSAHTMHLDSTATFNATHGTMITIKNETKSFGPNSPQTTSAEITNKTENQPSTTIMDVHNVDKTHESVSTQTTNITTPKPGSPSILPTIVSPHDIAIQSKKIITTTHTPTVKNLPEIFTKGNSNETSSSTTTTNPPSNASRKRGQAKKPAVTTLKGFKNSDAFKRKAREIFKTACKINELFYEFGNIFFLEVYNIPAYRWIKWQIQNPILLQPEMC